MIKKKSKFDLIKPYVIAGYILALILYSIIGQAIDARMDYLLISVVFIILVSLPHWAIQTISEKKILYGLAGLGAVLTLYAFIDIQFQELLHIIISMIFEPLHAIILPTGLSLLSGTAYRCHTLKNA